MARSSRKGRGMEVIVNIRMTEQQEGWLRELAARSGTTMSGWLRRHLTVAAQVERLPGAVVENQNAGGLG